MTWLHRPRSSIHSSQCARRHTPTLFLGCIQCRSCRLLLPMFAVSVSLSTRLHRAKTAEQIRFGVNTFGGPRNIVLDGGPDPPQRGEEDSMQPSPNYFGLLFRGHKDYSAELIGASSLGSIGTAAPTQIHLLTYLLTYLLT